MITIFKFLLAFLEVADRALIVDIIAVLRGEADVGDSVIVDNNTELVVIAGIINLNNNTSLCFHSVHQGHCCF